jgi:hypothetical protein
MPLNKKITDPDYFGGPRSPEGKKISSENALKHGLASGRIIIAGESQEAYDSLEASLLAEHEPANTTEQILVEEMARHFWLAQRAIRLQNEAFDNEGGVPANLALLLRYQTTNERAFHKALATFLGLRKEARKISKEFVSEDKFVYLPYDFETGEEVFPCFDDSGRLCTNKRRHYPKEDPLAGK